MREGLIFAVIIFRIMHVIRNTGERKGLFSAFGPFWACRPGLAIGFGPKPGLNYKMFLNAFLTRFLNDELQIRRFLLADWFSSVNGRTVFQLGRFIFVAVCSARSGFMFV